MTASSHEEPQDIRGMCEDLNRVTAKYLRGRPIDGYLGMALQAAWIAGHRHRENQLTDLLRAAPSASSHEEESRA